MPSHRIISNVLGVVVLLTFAVIAWNAKQTSVIFDGAILFGVGSALAMLYYANKSSGLPSNETTSEDSMPSLCEVRLQAIRNAGVIAKEYKTIERPLLAPVLGNSAEDTAKFKQYFDQMAAMKNSVLALNGGVCDLCKRECPGSCSFEYLGKSAGNVLCNDCAHGFDV